MRPSGSLQKITIWRCWALQEIVDFGCEGWNRTSDQMINSHLLYRLSYITFNWSGWVDLNHRPPASKAGRLTGLTIHPDRNLAAPMGLEPMTYGLTSQRSDQLSYSTVEPV